MSLRRDDWGGGALPAIGEEEKRRAHEWQRFGDGRLGHEPAGAAQPAYSMSAGSTRESSNQVPSEPNEWVRKQERLRPNNQKDEQYPAFLQRRRFNSSDVVSRGGGSSIGYGAYSVHGARETGSPTHAHSSWMPANAASAAQVPDVSLAQLLRHRQRRRTQSEITTKRARRTRATPRFKDRRSSLEDKENLVTRSNAEDRNDQNPAGRRKLEDDMAAYADDELSHDHSDQETESGAESDGGGETSKTRSGRAMSDDSNLSSMSSSSLYSNAVSRSYGSIDYHEPASTEKLLNLQKLYQEGFITVTEYKNRRLQLVDELSVTDMTIQRATDLIQTDMPVVYREPPDFTVLRERDAIKHIFDSEKRKWSSSRIKVKIDLLPFARGGLRQVFHLEDLSVIPRLGSHGRPVSYVAKIAIDLNENPDTYFRDVEMQAVASKFAKLYNTYNPPRRVEFLDAWILQLVPSGGDGSSDDTNLTMSGTICGVEPYIAGEYHKHNNNFGYVSELERNTPQAFSHFTYEASGCEMLIVDIQGVADHYTDPQIHTRSGKEFGKGNLSTRGFERFLESHRCNPICRYLKLPLNNPKDDTSGVDDGCSDSDAKGTVPAQPYMSQPRIRVNKVDSELCHYYGDSKAFKKYHAKHKHDSADADSTRAFVSALKEQRTCSSFCGVGQCVIS